MILIVRIVFIIAIINVSLILVKLLVLSIAYRSSVLIDEAKRRESSAKKKYNQQLKDTSPKLYNEPPNKRGT